MDDTVIKSAFQLILISALISGCVGRKGSREAATILYEDKDAKNRWEEVFRNPRDIYLQKPPDGELFRIWQVAVNKHHEMIIPQPNEIIVYDSTGRYLRTIGKKGSGPGEFLMISAVSLDKTGNLYVADVATRRISVFKAPSYIYDKSVFLDVPLSTNFVVSPNERFFVYTPYEPNVVIEFDSTGKRINEAVAANDQRLRMFLARMQPGGIVQNPNSNSLYAIYPERFILYKFDDQLNQIGFLKPSRSSTFFPNSPHFPSNLSPYGFSPMHTEWWDGFLHVLKIFFLNRDLLLIVLERTRGGNFEKAYVDLIRTDGKIIVKGAEVPSDGIVVGCYGNMVYVVRNAYMEETGRIRPLSLQCFICFGD